VTQELYAEFAAACGVIPPEPETLSMERWEELRRAHGLAHGYAAVQRFLWHGGKPIPGRENHPMVLVDHEHASFYCAWRGGRLPTEEEWERASRGPNGNAYPWGARYDPFRHNSAVRGAHDTLEVGSLPQGNTPTGFTDMGGLVFEWTSSPWPRRAGHFVVKGSGWNGRGGDGRGAARQSRAAEEIDVTLGFRCAADPRL
jgi:formylglycine-generating enzyme required for sulfatase activity